MIFRVFRRRYQIHYLLLDQLNYGNLNWKVSRSNAKSIFLDYSIFIHVFVLFNSKPDFNILCIYFLSQSEAVNCGSIHFKYLTLPNPPYTQARLYLMKILGADFHRSYDIGDIIMFIHLRIKRLEKRCVVALLNSCTTWHICYLWATGHHLLYKKHKYPHILHPS